MLEKIEKCTLCPRQCGAERYADYGKGYCKMGVLPKISRAAPHMWEEPCISGTDDKETVVKLIERIKALAALCG